MEYPDKQPETPEMRLSVYPALLHEAAFVGSYLPVLDNPLCSGLARYGLVVVSLGNNLPVYYFYFHA